MISIQDVGTQILSNTPKKFYVFLGSEYGIKDKYLQILKNHYGEQIESPDVTGLINMMRTKHIIPLTPKLYVVRYDEEFVASVSSSTQSLIDTTNIVGTIVCIYEQAKHANKLAKYLPEYSVSLDAVSPQFVKKYLHSDFPELPDRLLDVAVSATSNYSQARNMCRCMSAIPASMIYNLSDSELTKLFGCNDISTEAQIKAGVASRNFHHLLTLYEKYPDNVDSMMYTILSTMIELDKLMDNSYAQSDIKMYLKRWTRQDIYYMFVNTYQELQKLRSASSHDAENSLVYLISLLNFPSIPSPEVMK